MRGAGESLLNGADAGDGKGVGLAGLEPTLAQRCRPRRWLAPIRRPVGRRPRSFCADGFGAGYGGVGNDVGRTCRMEGWPVWVPLTRHTNGNGKLEWHFTGNLDEYLGDWPGDKPSVTLAVKF